jgi:hypothetical protein
MPGSDWCHPMPANSGMLAAFPDDVVCPKADVAAAARPAAKRIFHDPTLMARLPLFFANRLSGSLRG